MQQVTRMIRDALVRHLRAEVDPPLPPGTAAPPRAAPPHHVQTAILPPAPRWHLYYDASAAIMAGSGWFPQFAVSALGGYHGPPPETAEARAARLAQYRAAEAQQSAAAEAHSQAGLRAEALLQEYLSKEQLAALSLLGEFECVGQSGTRYRIRRGHSMNVEELDDQGWVVATLCAYPQLPEGGLPPDSDAMLAQFLLLTTDEPRFLAKAVRRAGD